MKFLAVLLLIFSTSQVHAEGCETLLAFGDMLEAEVRPLSFKGVEVFRRNNKLGQQQVGSVEFERWLELRPFLKDQGNFLGLTKDGRLYHLLQWGDRKIARLLNGVQQFKDFKVFEGRFLIAVDAQDQVQIYSSGRWLASPVPGLLKKGALVWLASTLTLTTVLGVISPESLGWEIPLGEVSLPLLPSWLASGMGLTTFFSMLRFYETSNTFPDGFVSLGFQHLDNQSTLHKINSMNLDSYLFNDHFDSVEVEKLTPPLPKEATEDIR